MPVIITGEFFKRDMHTPMQTHCRLDGGPRMDRAVRVVLMRKGTTKHWIGLVSDSPSQRGASVTDAAREYMEAACRMSVHLIYPPLVMWLRRDAWGYFERMNCTGEGVEFTRLDMPDVRTGSLDAVTAALRHEGIDPEHADISRTIQWAVTD